MKKNLLSHSACVSVCSLAPPPGQKELCRLKVWVSFPPVKILVPYLMFTLRYDITHGNSNIFLVVLCEEDHKRKKQCLSKNRSNLGHVSYLLILQKFPLELSKHKKFKQLSAVVCSLTVVLNEHGKGGRGRPFHVFFDTFEVMNVLIGSWSSSSDLIFLRYLETIIYLFFFSF